MTWNACLIAHLKQALKNSVKIRGSRNDSTLIRSEGLQEHYSI